MNQLKVEGVEITKVIDNLEQRSDLVVVEEPLEIRLISIINSKESELQLSVTMRTPGNDFELALGFLYTEGIIENISDVNNIRYCENVKESEKGNVVKVYLNENLTEIGKKLQRNFYTTSSCGVCGKSSIEAIHTIKENKGTHSYWNFNKSEILSIPQRIIQDQTVFNRTGGIHAAALIHKSGEVEIIREDIGRHNAVDKVLGAVFHKMDNLNDYILFVSGRAGFELVQKAIIAGISVFVAVGAPSNLAVSLAKDYNMALIGFLRNEQFNIYHGLERLKD